MEADTLTIGELARRVGMRTSALRYYEEQELLSPAGYTEAGYRLYTSEAEQTIKFIQRAQQLGFSLADIGVFLKNQRAGCIDTQSMTAIAQERYLFLERQVTQLLVLQHELGLFLQDLQQQTPPACDPSSSLQWSKLLDHVCSNPLNQPVTAVFDWLMERTGCTLTSLEGQALIDSLRGQHVHIWQEGDGYHILVVSKDPQVGRAMQTLAEMETNCQVHTYPHQSPELMHNGEGYLLVTHGENGFIFARLFLLISDKKIT